jgi:hypothetical protein
VTHEAEEIQLAICDLCQSRVADRCHARLRLQVCRRCALFVEVATGDSMTGEEDFDLEAA